MIDVFAEVNKHFQEAAGGAVKVPGRDMAGLLNELAQAKRERDAARSEAAELRGLMAEVSTVLRAALALIDSREIGL